MSHFFTMLKTNLLKPHIWFRERHQIIMKLINCHTPVQQTLKVVSRCSIKSIIIKLVQKTNNFGIVRIQTM